ncbi:hypothetical protein GGR56DRAFT_686612 [Xylariaceae sp. FL0804]|nr:hypothetical protein GGR56DRAFT_686612 [Xylariaceae sp. FL0804]
MRLRNSLVGTSLVFSGAPSLAQFNNPPGVDIWCGKAYREGNSSFDPGGWFQEPPVSDVPLLNLWVRPRMSIYLDTDTTASLLIDAGVSYQIGESLPPAFLETSPPGSRKLAIHISSNGSVPSNGSRIDTVTIELDSTNVEIPLDLGAFPPATDPYAITVQTVIRNLSYTASTSFYRLPSPDGYGSISRIDNLYGGLWAKRDGEDWSHIFPYTYYVQWSLYWDANISTLDEFASMGYNVIHIVPTGTLGDTPFPWEQFEPYLRRADELGLYLQYDVLWDYQNLTGMVEQVERLRAHRSLLLWYQSDEPDGKGDPVNSTAIAYRRIRALDPYHPVSLALNCYDFYYAEYAAGADIVTTDTYPVAVNTTWSAVYDTACNATYGCCGCDDCRGRFEDVSERIDELARRDALLGRGDRVQWYAPQAFGNETFWSRYPTAAEEQVLTLLAVNHGAKGVVMWDFPTSPELASLTGRLAAVLTRDDVADFLLGAPLTRLDVRGADRVDAAAWFDADAKKLLLSTVNLNYHDVSSTLTISLPGDSRVCRVAQVLWGEAAWGHVEGGGILSADGMPGLGVNIIEFDTC